jgi:anti-anti-sigma regulatory factor
METELEQHAAFLLARVKGDLRLHGLSSLHFQLSQFRESAIEQAPGAIVLSLQALNYSDSLGIAELAMFPMECGKRRLRLAVVMPGGMMREALQRLRIFDASARFEDEAAAIQAAAEPGAQPGQA